MALPAVEIPGLTEDQRELVKAVQDFAEHELAPHSLEWDRDKHFPTDVLAAAGDLGLGAMFAAEQYGGIGLDRLDGCLVFEHLARGDVPVAAYVSIHNMVVWMIDRFGDDAQRAHWIPRLADLRTLASYCLTEPDVGSDAARLRTRAVPDGDGWRLEGTKQFISGAGYSGLYLVMARTGADGSGGISAFLVPGDSTGLSFGPPERKMGWNAQPTAQVVLDGVRVGPEALLGAPGEGFTMAMRGLNGGRLNIGACSLGGATWALQRATDYLRDRTAFGRPLIQQQALQFRLADMATDVHASRLVLHSAARALDAGSADAVVQCAMAKRFVTDACYQVADAALQLHGGYGYLAEYGIEKVVRDLRVHQILEGTNEIMRVIVGRAMVGSDSERVVRPGSAATAGQEVTR